MENTAKKYYERWQDAKKKYEKYRDIIIELRTENKLLKEEQSCAGRNRESLYTRDTKKTET